MSIHTIQVSETVYLRISERAARLQITPEQLIERLLTTNLLTFVEDTREFFEPMPPAHSEVALAAVRRLTTCFAGVSIPDLEATLADPLLTLANADMDQFLQ
ncbi:MAG: hypothetical protein HC884_06810 [Chloroflexaceae bacterium]|nr:hypothetical protein [Chloroflexaceae bacterium]